MKILITGGAGFIGSRVGQFYSFDNDVTLVDNMSYGRRENLYENCNFIETDVRGEDFSSLCYGKDVVLHFAAIAPLPDNQVKPVLSYENNVLGTLNVLESCRKAGVKKIIFASTSAVYENCLNIPFKEEPLSEPPDLFYSMSKKVCEDICLSYVKNYDMDITVLRFFNVYGPNQDHKRKQPPLMGYIVKCLIEDEQPTFYSNGEQKRDYIFVEDVCSLVDLCIKSDKSCGEIFNACSGESFSVKQIYNLYREEYGSGQEAVFQLSEEFWHKYPDLFSTPFPLKKERVAKEVNKFSLGSAEKAKKILGFVPKYQIREGIRMCLEEVKKCTH